MSAPASEDLRELERDLLLAAERGETVSVAAVQESCGVGHNDAMELLSRLREHGKAVEVAPGEWSGPAMGDLEATSAPEPARVVVSVPDGDAGREPVAERHFPPALSFTPTVRLTMAICEALDADALGKLVKAAIDAVGDGESFVLEVTP